jgi:hypothetical protein
LPRNEKERFETPPLVFEPGQRSLSSGSASMNAFANPLCSSMPVATARMCRDGEDVHVEDDVLGREADDVDEQPVGALADGNLALDRLGLPLLVERHHDDASSVAADDARLLEERLLALLEAERVDDALALQALESGLEHPRARSR